MTIGEGTGGDVLHIAAWVVAGVIIAWFVVRPFLVWWSTTYTFTNRRFMERTGIIAQKGRTIPLNRISGVDFEIDLTDRIFGCGTLVVTDASEAGRVELHDIPRVEKVQLKVADELHRLYGRSDDGA
nr:PH domain-containing protein [Nocardioides daedukensis]